MLWNTLGLWTLLKKFIYLFKVEIAIFNVELFSRGYIQLACMYTKENGIDMIQGSFGLSN